MKLAALQFRPPHARPAVAREALRELIMRANGAHLVVCPEMASTGYVFESAEEIAPHAEAPVGPTFAMLSTCAMELNAWIVCGIAERADEGMYNSALTVSPRGQLINCYRKVMLFEQDTTWALPGDERPMIQTRELGRLSPAICMDLNDDGFAHFLGDASPDVVAFCTNWIEEGIDMLPYWRMRLGGWQGWFVAADRWGEERGTRFYGRSAILGPNGAVLGPLPAAGDAVLIADTHTNNTETR